MEPWRNRSTRSGGDGGGLFKHKMNTLQFPIDARERHASVPSGPCSSAVRGPSSTTGFRHFGSSLSLAEEPSLSELTSRTLRPPSPTTLKKGSVPGKPRFPTVPKSSKPALPSLNSIELRSPKLADYLERPRLVSMVDLGHLGSRTAASQHHAKRLNAGRRNNNLRLGNFFDSGECDDELIPDRLRQYYLDTYLNVCDTCESKTHLDPSSPIQRGM